METEQVTETITVTTVQHKKKQIIFGVAVVVLVATASFLFVRYYMPIYEENQREKVIKSLKEEGVYQTEADKKAVINGLNSNPVLNDKDWEKVIKELNKK